jgi:hypothetical protein
MTELMCQPFGLLSSFLELPPVVITTGRGCASLSGFEQDSFHREQNSHQNKITILLFVAQPDGASNAVRSKAEPWNEGNEGMQYPTAEGRFSRFF